jgi:hypothetical protein
MKAERTGIHSTLVLRRWAESNGVLASQTSSKFPGSLSESESSEAKVKLGPPCEAGRSEE